MRGDLPGTDGTRLRASNLMALSKTIIELACPTPLPAKDTILLGHGSGGKLSAELVREVFLPALHNAILDRLDDQGIFAVGNQRLAMTTDSFVVKPLFFPGGDIGSLAVHGTVNDLAMGGAKPLYLSVAFIIEEGFAIEELQRIVKSLHRAAEDAGVQVITGDTKVVERGKGDGVFINTTGIGIVPQGLELSANRARPGDKVYSVARSASMGSPSWRAVPGAQPAVEQAWDILREKILVASNPIGGHGVIFQLQPALRSEANNMLSAHIAYHNADLVRAWELLLQAGPAAQIQRLSAGPGGHDATALGNLGLMLRDEMAAAYDRKDAVAFEKAADQFMALSAPTATAPPGRG